MRAAAVVPRVNGAAMIVMARMIATSALGRTGLVAVRGRTRMRMRMGMRMGASAGVCVLMGLVTGMRMIMAQCSRIAIVPMSMPAFGRGIFVPPLGTVFVVRALPSRHEKCPRKTVGVQ